MKSTILYSSTLKELNSKVSEFSGSDVSKIHGMTSHYDPTTNKHICIIVYESKPEVRPCGWYD